MDLLPKMCSEYLNQGNLKCWDLAMHEDTSQVKLHLEADIDISSVDSWRPPKCKSSVRNLIQTRSLGMSQLLKLHRLLEARCFLPEKALPSWEVGSFEESML
jgi:hypothetical protein